MGFLILGAVLIVGVLAVVWHIAGFNNEDYK